MNISINDKQIQIAQELSLLDLLTMHDFVTKIGIAVAVNQSVIAKEKWKELIIKENDKVLIISATKGG